MPPPFVKECGSYHYLRAPQSFQASGDHYTKRKYEMTKDIKNKREIVDDTLLFEDSLEKLFLDHYAIHKVVCQ